MKKLNMKRIEIYIKRDLPDKVTSHDHPSNGWLALGYKPMLLGLRLKALAFSLSLNITHSH